MVMLSEIYGTCALTTLENSMMPCACEKFILSDHLLMVMITIIILNTLSYLLLHDILHTVYRQSSPSILIIYWVVKLLQLVLNNLFPVPGNRDKIWQVSSFIGRWNIIMM